MGLENEDIQRLIDFMYVGIYGVDAIGFNWRLGRVPSVYINVRMYRMGVRFDMPSLVSFALEAIYRTFKIADRQDMEYAINDVWSTPDENEDLRAMLIHLDMDAMLSDKENLERWLGRTSTPYRHPA
ncbi:hypothetical protein NW768_008087 [Fusarium equiseti]|uniref:Uncharacterized protein n=1 Tax=Fusarium equiseti TaxID=61235 RepID=A0ABQ8R6B1_FUSEQ|nr:hypothetical protein NW768_008087 [Fusarium equiseti]